MIKEKTAEEWLRIFNAAGGPAAPLLYIEEMIDHPQSHATGMIIEQQHPVGGRVRYAGPLSKWWETQLEPVRISPSRGEHTREVLSEAGYSEAEIEAFHKGGSAKTG